MSLDKSQIIDLTKPSTRDYKKFLLKHNPFPATGVPDDTPAFTVDREDAIKKFQNVIFEIIQSGSSVLTVLVGENGSGKSHILRLFKYNINAQLLNRENGMLAAYVKNPGREFYDMYKATVDDVGKSHFSEIVFEFISEQIKSNPSFKQYFTKKIFYDQFVNGTLSLDAVLGECQYLDLQKDIYRLKFSHIGNSDVVSALLSLTNPNFSSHAWQWLLGEKMERSEKDSIGVGSSITEENAYSIFADLIKALSVMNIKYFALFVDELEEITKLSKTKIDAYHNSLRQLIDDNPKNMCLYFAITPQQWEKLLTVQTALVRRLSTNWYILDEFKENETKMLLERYLHYSRIEDFTSKIAKERFPTCEPSLCPFTMEDVSLIHKRTKGVVSDVLKMSRTLLENKVDNGEVSAITAEEVTNLKMR